MSEKGIVLSSGGVDSTTCLGVAVARLGKENVSTLSVFYGQKHERELQAARKVASWYGVRHDELDLSAVLAYSDCSLLRGSEQKIQHISYSEQVQAGSGKVSTYVPFRNGLMLSAAASMADSLYPEEHCIIFLGAHGDDAAGNAYADCSEDFVAAMSQAISIGTYGQDRVEAPFAGLNKAAVVKRGLELNVPYALTWSCYEGGEEPCGTCGTCRDRAAAFAANGVPDPALHRIERDTK